MKRFFLLFFLTNFFLIIAYNTPWAQCTNVSINLTSQPSTCQSNGIIGVAVTGPDASNLRMSDAEYNIVPVSGTSFSRPWAQAPGGTLTNVPPGTYSVGLRAFCTASGSWTVHASSGNIGVANSYTVPNIYFGSIRKTLSCIPSGKIPIMIQNGRVPFVITMTAFPTGYTGPTSATVTTLSGTPPSATYNFDDLPAGSYTFSVTDNCTYNTTLNATVAVASADHDQGFAYNYLYMPSAATMNDCQSVRVYVIYNSSGNVTHDAHDHYYNNTAKYYEVAFNEDNINPPTTGWATPTTYMNYTLSVPFDQFKAQNKYVAIWVRIKGTSCVSLLRTATLYTTYSSVINYTNVTCTDFTVSHYPSYASIYAFCMPYEWRITANSGSSVIVPWSSPVSATNTYQVANNIPYGTRLEYRDAGGQTWTANLMSTSPMNNINITYTANSCLSNSLAPTAAGILSGSVYLYYSNGSFPIGTRIEYLSGPAGAPTPTHSDITTTTAVSYVYPFTSSTNYTSQTTPYPLNVPGTYSFRVTIPTCAPQTYSINPLFYRVVTPLSYTATEACNGLQLYPTGQLGYIQGASSVTQTTYFSIETAPTGVTVDRTGVTAGQSLLLPASGSYVIKMTFSRSTNVTNYCAASTILVNYTKQQMKLDVSVTSAYVCAGGSLGNIRVQGQNGSGSYTYELWSSDLLTRHLVNTAGTFSYGSAGQTFIVRVIDNVCNTSFDQSVTILDLSTAQILYSGSQNNEFCEGGTIQLNCITLGQTSYTWSGPNGWTSSLQNPSIPNATPGMSGTYTVTVTPENCGSPMSQSIAIKVNPKPPLPTVPNISVSLCRNATAQTIAAITSASATSSSYQLRYYNDSGSTITSTTTVPTSAATVLTYYVTQYNTTTACESNRVTVTVTVNDLPAAPTVNTVSAMCSGASFSITVSPTTSGYYYKVYTASSGGTLLGQSAVNSGIISGLSAPVSSTTYYVSAVNGSNCESASRTPVAIPINPSVTPTISISASGNNICSGTSVTYTANITNGGTSPGYRWQVNGVPVGGATASTYSYQPANGDIVTCVLTSNASCPTSNPVTATPITMVVIPIVNPSVTISGVPD